MEDGGIELLGDRKLNLHSVVAVLFFFFGLSVKDIISRMFDLIWLVDGQSVLPPLRHGPLKPQ